MPVSSENINKEVYDILRSRGFDPVSLDSKGQQDIDIEDADVFRFQFKDKDDDLGTVWVTIEDKELNFYTDDDISEQDAFLKFLHFMKKWSQRKLLGFKITNKNHLSGDMKKRTSMKKKQQLGEGYYSMGKKASYSDTIPQVKMILQHTRPIEEGEQRYRNIAKIFVENLEGERFLLPTNRPGLARVFARHIAEGGTPYDERGAHITTLVEEYTKMAGFVRATKNGQFNESAQRLVNEGVNHYQNLRETLSRMTSHRGYNTYFESYTPVLNEQSDDEVSLNELFVQETLDPRIENVLPILNRLSRNITEMSEVAQLEEWADSITMAEGDVEEGKADILKKVRKKFHRLEEGFTDSQEIADMIIQSLGGESDLSSDDIYRAIGEYQTMMDNPHKLDVDEVAQIVMDKLGSKELDEGSTTDTMDHDAENMTLKQFLLKHGDDELAREFWHKVNGVDEGLDANQKRAGQLGPTEKVGPKGAVGKLVGASESVELDKLKALSGIK
jgi:hypothetical protein